MRTFFVIILGSFLGLTQTVAKELVLLCPSEIPAASIHDVEIEPGWRVFNPNKLKLRSATFIGASPEAMMELVPFQV